MMRRQGIRISLLAAVILFLAVVCGSHITALATPAAGVIQIGGASYPTLEAAILAAQPGDTLTLTGGDLTISQTVSIPADKNLTLDLGGNALISRIDTGTLRMLSIKKTAGMFTLKNGKLLAEDVNGDGVTGGAIESLNADLSISGVEASGFSAGGRGGVVKIDGVSTVDVNISITNSHFHNNAGKEMGGAISMMGLSPSSKVQILDNTIANNTVTGGSSSYGGGIALAGKGTYTIRGNTIDSNKSVATQTSYGFYWSHGGGLSVDSPINTKGTMHLILEDNLISQNQTQLFGGGIYFAMSKKSKDGTSGDTIDLRSGAFLKNHSGYAGGAIDFSVHGQPTLILKNAIFTENQSRAGGAIWACPTARIVSHSTMGGVLTGNLLDASSINSVYKPSGHEVRFEGADTQIGGILAENDPAYHRVTVFERTFLGDKVNWYADEPDALYQPGDTPVSKDYYTDRDTSFGVYGELASPEDWYERHKEKASLIFEGNTAARRGGAISTNSDMQIGLDEDIDVSVSKQWVDESGAVISEGVPASIDVQLIRNDSNDGSYPLETITLTAGSGWTHTFEKLPTRGMVGIDILHYTYTVQELPTPGFYPEYDSDTPSDITIRNAKTQFINIPVNKVWTDTDDQDGSRPSSVTMQLYEDGAAVPGQTITLSQANGWASAFTNLPAHKAGKAVTYTVDEVDIPAGYTKTVSGSKDEGFTITNAKLPTPSPTPSVTPTPPPPPTPTYPTTRVPLKARKVLINGNLSGGDFRFELRDVNGKVIAEASNAADGTIIFPDRTFSKAVSNWMYTIRETPGGDPNMIYDETVYTVRVSTKPVGGKLEAVLSIEKDDAPYAGVMTFTNTRKIPKTGDKIHQIVATMLGLSLIMLAGAHAINRVRCARPDKKR